MFHIFLGLTFFFLLHKMLAVEVEPMEVLNQKKLLKDLTNLRYQNPLLISVLRASSSRGRIHLRCQEMLDHSDGLVAHRKAVTKEMRSQNLMMNSEKCLWKPEFIVERTYSKCCVQILQAKYHFGDKVMVVFSNLLFSVKCMNDIWFSL